LSVFRLVPPAGAPLPARAVLSSIVQRPGGHRPPGALVREQLGARHAVFVSSGRAALAVVLDAMRQGSARREVVVPAYTCFSVPSAVARAGLTLRLCDVDPRTLDLDVDALRRLDLSKALCIVPSGLYGLPSNLVELEKIAQASGATLVDDAAQTLGASLHGRPCGTFGDAGFFSLGRGKGISTMGGGILVTHRQDLADTIEVIMRSVRRPSAREACAAIGGALIYTGMVKPSRYWLVDRMPFLGLGGSNFEPEFPIAQLSPYQQRLAGQLLPLVDTFNKTRRDHADHLRAGIEGVDGIEVPRPVGGASAVYLRFPILTRDGTHRDRLFHRLGRAGIRASASYPTSVGDIPGIERYLAPDQAACPAARSVAGRILTLPTHAWVTAHDVDRMVSIIRDDGDRSRPGSRA
jgi:dTDP-4-amino-4,6-dideoxygalactose transaminase